MSTETHSSQLQSYRRISYEDTRDSWEPRARKSISLWGVGPVGQEKWKQPYCLPLPFCLHRLGFRCFPKHMATYSSCIVPLDSSHIQDLTDTSPNFQKIRLALSGSGARPGPINGSLLGRIMKSDMQPCLLTSSEIVGVFAIRESISARILRVVGSPAFHLNSSWRKQTGHCDLKRSLYLGQQ